MRLWGANPSGLGSASAQGGKDVRWKALWLRIPCPPEACFQRHLIPPRADTVRRISDRILPWKLRRHYAGVSLANSRSVVAHHHLGKLDTQPLRLELTFRSPLLRITC